MIPSTPSSRTAFIVASLDGPAYVAESPGVRRRSADAAPGARPAFPRWRILLWVHAGAFLLFSALFAVLFALSPPGGGRGVNFGALFAEGPVFLLALPWSILGKAAFDTFGPDHAYANNPPLIALNLAAYLGGAPLNLGLHAIVYTVISRRRLRHFAASGRAAPSR